MTRELLERVLREAEARVAAWPEWKRIMYRVGRYFSAEGEAAAVRRARAPGKER